MRSIAAIIFLILSAAAARAADVDFDRLRDALNKSDYGSVADQLKSIESSQPRTFAERHLDYLLARTLERLGDTSGAVGRFESVRRRGGPLRDHALWHLSTLARSSGNLFLERIYLSELAAFNDGSLFAIAARERLAESYLDSGDHAAAIRLLSASLPAGTLSATLRAAPDTNLSRRRLSLLARASLLAGDTAAAVDLYNDLLASTANADQPDDYALAAVKGLDQVDAAPANLSLISDAEHFRRAGVYHFNREFDEARRHYLALLEAFSSSALAPNSIFQIGRTFAQEGNYVDAVKWFEREQEQTSGTAITRDSLLQAASAYARLGKHREAIQRYLLYIQNYPDEPGADRAYLNIIDALRDAGEETAAIAQAKKVQDVFRGKQTAALALFAEARIRISQADWANALAALDELAARPDLGGTSVPGGTSVAEVSFLRGYVLEQAGRFAEAIDAFLAVPDGANEFYGGLATARLSELSAAGASKAPAEAKLAELTAAAFDSRDAKLRARVLSSALRLAPDDATRRTLTSALEQAYSRIPAYSRPFRAVLLEPARRQPFSAAPNAVGSIHRRLAGELISLGLYDEAAPEFEASLAARPSDPRSSGAPARRALRPDDAYTLATLYARGGRADRATALIGTLWSITGDAAVETVDRERARFSYPAPYKDVLLREASPRGIDPRFLLSIIRQESGFRPNAKSNAAARGLMQFITTTAADTARDLGRSDFRSDDLYDPRVSIEFGSQYIESLFTLFPGLPDAVAASYNGGEDNMKRWLARCRSQDPGRYVPEILFAQSKDYVQRVMSAYRMYKLLYDENLEPRADL